MGSLSTTRRAHPDARILIGTRAIRGFVDGIAYVILPAFLLHLGFSGTQIGAVITASLLGSAALTLSVGVFAHRFSPARLLTMSSLLMIVTGFAFGMASAYGLLLVIAAVGTMNPSAGDVSVFLPLEQSLLSSSIKDSDRTSVFAVYNLSGSLVGSIGALSAGIPVWIATSQHRTADFGHRASFMLYGIAGIAVLVFYSRLSLVSRDTPTKADRALGESKHIVYKLAALFSLDSFGGGFATQAIFALWVYRRFELSSANLGMIFFAAGMLDGGNRYSNVDVYDAQAGTWSTISGRLPRYDFAATSVGGVAIFAGGNIGTLYFVVPECWHCWSNNSYFLRFLSLGL
mgnify:CR=1 FL=1